MPSFTSATPGLVTQGRHTTKIPLACLESAHSRSLTTTGTTDLVGDSFMVPPHCASRTGHRTKTLPPNISIHLDWKSCRWIEIVTFVHTEVNKDHVSLCPTKQFWINNVSQAPMIMKTLSECARAVAQEPSPREERSSGRRPRGVASANARRDQNLRTTCRGSPP